MTDFQYETIDEYKKDIILNDIVNGDEMSLDEMSLSVDSIFNENIKTATEVYFLLDKKRFHVLSTNSLGDELFTCNIQCYDDVTVKKLLSILQFYVDQGVKVKRFGRELFVSQIKKRSYLYLALFQGMVVTWIHKMRKLIP